MRLFTLVIFGNFDAFLTFLNLGFKVFYPGQCPCKKSAVLFDDPPKFLYLLFVGFSHGSKI